MDNLGPLYNTYSIVGYDPITNDLEYKTILDETRPFDASRSLFRRNWESLERKSEYQKV